MDFRRAEYTGADHANSVGIGPIELWIFVTLASRAGVSLGSGKGELTPQRPEGGSGMSGDIRERQISAGSAGSGSRTGASGFSGGSGGSWMGGKEGAAGEQGKVVI